jgi:hypothetical protein
MKGREEERGKWSQQTGIKGKEKRQFKKPGPDLAVEKDFAKVKVFYYIYSMPRPKMVRSFCQEEVFVYIVDER